MGNEEDKTNDTSPQGSPREEQGSEPDDVGKRREVDSSSTSGEPSATNEGLAEEEWLQILSQSYSGPIPPPHLLEGFDRVVPGAAEQMLNEAHTESDHRRYLERIQVEAAVKESPRGQIFAFIIAMTVIVGGIGLIAFGRGAWGLALLLPGLAALIGAYILNEVRRVREMKQVNQLESQDAPEERDSSTEQ